MVKKFPIIIFIAILIMDVLPSCYDKDFLDISDSVRWHPSFSLPVGSSSFKVDNFFANYNLSNELDSLIGLPDTLIGLPDSILIGILDSLGILDTLNLDSIYFNDTLKYLYQKKILIDDDFDFDFENINSDYDKIDSMLFRVYVENGYPTETDVQIYMIDSANNVIDSIFTIPSSNIFPPGSIVDSNGVIEATVGSIDIPFNRDRMDKIKPARNLLLNINISTTSDKIQKTKFYSSYDVYVKLGISVAFHTDFSLSNNN